GGWGAERALADLCAGAGEGEKRHRQVRLLDRQCQRGAHLVAVERAMAGCAHPACPVARPILLIAAPRCGAPFAGAIAAVASPPGTEIVTARGAEKTAEAESLVGERNRAVGIAFARGDPVAQARDQHAAHPDLG